MTKLPYLLVTAALIAAAAEDADAYSHHEKVTVSEMKSKGEVVGVRIKMTLRPDSSGYKQVRVGIGPPGGNHDSGDGWRKKASDSSAGHLLHQFPAITDIKNNTPKELTLEVKYADAPNLKPGQEVEIISAWHGHPTSPNHWHIWGMSSPMSGPVKAINLPGKLQSQQQQLARRSPKSAKSKRTVTAQRPKASTRKMAVRKQPSKATVLEASKATRGLGPITATTKARASTSKVAGTGKAARAHHSARSKRAAVKRVKVKAR